MSKLTLTDVTSGYASTTAINANNTLIEAALENTLSRDGTSPNTMNVDLDMNGHRILNELAQSGVGFIWKNAWVTATAYVLNNLVSNAGKSYICTLAHTSGTFGNDLSTGKWELLADQGATGPGSGDMVGANNLSDVANKPTALATLGGAVLAGSGTQTFSVAAATAVAHAVRADQIQAQVLTAFTSGGTSTAYTLTAVPAITAYVVGQRFRVKFHTANGLTPTININGLGGIFLVRENLDGTLTTLVAHSSLQPCIATNHFTDIEIVSGTQAKVIELPPRTFSGTLTRDLTTASGSVSTTGLGFMPRKISIALTIAGTVVSSTGYAGGAGNGSGQCVYSAYVSSASGFSTTACVLAYAASSAYQFASIASFDTDGFTLSWTKVNTPTGTANMVYIAEE